MAKTGMIRARAEPELKSEAEEILHQLGLSRTQAITVFYRQIILQPRLPIELAVPNAQISEVFERTDAGKDLVRCSDPDDMFEKLGI